MKYWLLLLAPSAVMSLSLCGSVEVTDRMRRMCAALERACFRAGLNRKGMAAHMGVSPTLLTRQLDLRDGAHPSVARMGNLPDDALLNFAQEICDQHGEARVVSDQKLDQVLRWLETHADADAATARRRA